MLAVDVIKQIFSETNWEFSTVNLYGKEAFVVDFDVYQVTFAALHDEELYLSCKLCKVDDSEDTIDLLKNACSHLMSIWKDHRLNVAIEGNSLILERVIKINTENAIDATEKFLDDCDWYTQNVIKKEPLAGFDVFAQGVLP